MENNGPRRRKHIEKEKKMMMFRNGDALPPLLKEWRKRYREGIN